VLLAVDVGNTQTHLGAFRGEELVEHWRFATVRESTADELGAALRNLLALRRLSFDDLDGSIISTTVPQLGPEWADTARRYLGHEMLVVGPGLKTGMPIRLDNPRELGPDRLVNAVAAHARFGGPCIVVDFGTANTFDVVSAEGEYLGGIIALGVEISLEALTERAARLPKVEVHGGRDPLRRHLRRGRPGRRDRPAPVGRAGGGGQRDRHRRAGRAHRPPRRDDRRGRRSPDAHRPTLDP